MNQKIDTKLGVIIIIIIAITLGAFLWVWEKGENEIVNLQVSEQSIKEDNMQSDIGTQPADVEKQGQQKNKVVPVDTSSWKTCMNEKSNYEFKYPSDWLIVDRYLTVLNDCYDPDAPRGTGFSIGEDRYSVNNKNFGINTSSQEDLKNTMFKGVASLDEYYDRNEKLTVGRAKIKETVIDGERADWFREKDNEISIWFFQKGTFYRISTNIQDINLIEAIANTFKFPNN